jgi:NAD(P)H-hydrate epimerase
MTNEHRILSKKLPERDKSANKGDFGRLTVIGGSSRYRGAMSLACEAALRTGVGLVKLVSTEKVVSAVASRLCECTYLPISENSDGAIDSEDFISKQKELKSSSCVLVGCGMTACRSAEEIVSSVIYNMTCPLVIDADGLNVLRFFPERLRQTKRRPVITPHVGEMSRLTGIDVDRIKEERVKVALDFSVEHNCVTVLKDSVTTVVSPDGEVFINTVENSGLAKGGSGDVLAGIIASMLCQGLSDFDAACCGVLLHSLSAEMTAEELGEEYMLPTDVISHLPKVMAMIRKENEQ